MADVTELRRRLTKCCTYLGRSLVLTGLALVEVLLISWLCVAITLLVVGVGVFLVPAALSAIQREANLQRRLASQWSGVTIPAAISEQPPRGTGLRDRWRWMIENLAEPATWRDLMWPVVNPLVGPLMVFFPTLAIVHGIWGVVLLGLWQSVISHWESSWYLFIPLRNEFTAVISAILGVFEVALGLVIAAPLVGLHGRWVRHVIGRPTGAQLQRRIERLASTRSEVVNRQASQIRNIERDLHDGAQVRLVAMGMTLAAAERLIDTKPDAARALLVEARETSSQALNDLRELVRGIHPPVLADRGLIDALRSRALESPMHIEISGDLRGYRAPPPLEAAMYFATTELLTNAAKHAQSEHIWVNVTHHDGTLRVEVRDDGVGGADASRGSGLDGVRERVQAFDGSLRLTSPVGGPTTAMIEAPCALDETNFEAIAD